MLIYFFFYQDNHNKSIRKYLLFSCEPMRTDGSKQERRAYWSYLRLYVFLLILLSIDSTIILEYNLLHRQLPYLFYTSYFKQLHDFSVIQSDYWQRMRLTRPLKPISENILFLRSTPYH